MVSDRILKIVKCMKSDENGKVEFVLSINGEEKRFWPSQLAGSYIADRIEDIKAERKTNDLSLVISVFDVSWNSCLGSFLFYR